MSKKNNQKNVPTNDHPRLDIRYTADKHGDLSFTGNVAALDKKVLEHELFSTAVANFIRVELYMSLKGCDQQTAGKELKISVQNCSTLRTCFAGLARIGFEPARHCDESALRLLVSKTGKLSIEATNATIDAMSPLETALRKAARGGVGVQFIAGACGVAADKANNIMDKLAAERGQVTAANFADYFKAFKELWNKPAKEKDLIKQLEKVLSELGDAAPADVHRARVLCARFQFAHPPKTAAQSDEIDAALNGLNDIDENDLQMVAN